jgi:hypothetical protein
MADLFKRLAVIAFGFGALFAVVYLLGVIKP